MNVQTHPDRTEVEFALLAAILSAHQNSALSDVREQVGELSVRRLWGEFQ